MDQEEESKALDTWPEYAEFEETDNPQHHEPEDDEEDYEEDLDQTVRIADTTTSIRGMQLFKLREGPFLARVDTKNNAPRRREEHDARISMKGRSHEQPTPAVESNYPLTIMVNCGGCKLYTLIDSGSTANVVSPEAVRVAGLKPFP